MTPVGTTGRSAGEIDSRPLSRRPSRAAAGSWTDSSRPSRPANPTRTYVAVASSRRDTPRSGSLSENRHIFGGRCQKGVGSRFRHAAGSHYGSFSGRNRLPTPFAATISRRGRFVDSLLATRPSRPANPTRTHVAVASSRRDTPRSGSLSENRHIFGGRCQKGVGSRFRHDAGWHYGSFSGRNRLPTPFRGEHPLDAAGSWTASWPTLSLAQSRLSDTSSRSSRWRMRKCRPPAFATSALR